MPNVLDENVIVLKFQNENFEKNVEASASALEKLNKTIEGATATKADFDGLANSIKNIDVSHLADGVETVSRRFKTIGIVGASVINKLTNNAIDSGIAIAKKLPQTIIQGGWRRALNIEQAEFLMEGLGFKFEGTFDKVTKEFTGIKGAVLAAVDDTRYGLDEAAKIAAQLMASGVTEVDTLAARLKAISGLASVANAEFSDIGRIFSQVAGQGRMMGDDLLQISERGINAAAKIAEYLNANGKVKDQALETAIAQGNQVKKMKAISEQAKISEADVREMVSAGAISFDIMAASFEGFFEQAKKANNTYEGSLANVKASLSRMGAQFEAVKLENMTKIFNTLLPVLKKLEDFIEPVTKKIGEMSSKATDFINEGIINKIGKELGIDSKDLFHGFAEAVNEAGESTKKTTDKVEDLGDKIKVSKKEWQAALDIWYKGTYGTGAKRKNSIEQMGMSYEHVQGIINKFYKNGFNWDKTKESYDIGSKKTKENTEAVEENVEAVVQQEEALSSLGKVVTGVINLTKAFINTIKGVYNTIVAIKNAFTSVGHSLLDTIGTALIFVSDKVLKLSRSFADVMTKIAANGDEFKTLVKEGNLLAVSFKMIGKVSNVLSKGIDKVTSTIRNIFKTIGQAKKEAKSSSKEISGLAKVFRSFSNIGKIVVNFLKGFGNLIDIAVSKVKSLKIEFDGFGKIGIGNFLSKVGDRFAKWLLDLSEWFLKLSESFLKFTETLKAGGEQADKLTNKGTKLGNVLAKFKEIGGSIRDSLKKIGSAVSSKTFEIFDKLENTFTSLKDTMGSLKGGSLIAGVFLTMAKAVSNFLVGLSSGQQVAGSFFSTLGVVVNKVFDTLSTALGWIIDKIGPAIDKIVEFFKQMAESEGVDKLKSALSGLIDSMTGMANSGFGTVVGWFKELSGFSFGGGGLSNAVTFFSSIAGAIGDFIDKINKGENPFTIFFDTFGKIKEMLSFKLQAKESLGQKFSDIINAPAIGTSLGQLQKFDVGGKSLKATTSIIDVATKLSDGLNEAAISNGIKRYLNEIKDADLEKLSRLALKFVSIGAILKSVKDMSTLANSVAGVMKSISGFVGSLSGIAQQIQKSIKIEQFRTIAMSIGILVACIVVLATIPTDRLIPALIGVIGLLSALAFVISIMSKDTFDPRRMIDIGVAFLGVGAGVFLLASALKMISKLSLPEIAKGAAVVIGFMAAMTLMSRFAKKIEGAGLAFMSMAIAVNLLVSAILAFAVMPWTVFVKGAKCVAIVIGILAGAARIAGSGAKGSMAFFAMAVALYALIPAIILMALIPTEKALQGAFTISGVLVALGVAARIAGDSKAGIKTMASMAGVIVALTASLVVLSFIDTQALQTAVMSLVEVMAALAIAGTIANAALKGLWSMAGVIAVLTACIAALIYIDADAAITVTQGISEFILNLGIACGLLGLIGWAGALSALAALSIFLAGIGIIVGILANLPAGAMDGIKRAEEIMHALGEVFGSFVGGMITGATEDLPKAAEDLKKFTDVLIPALDSISGLKDSKDSITALRELIESFAILVGGNAFSTLTEKLGGGEATDFSQFGDSLAGLAKSFVPFGQAVDEGLNDDAIDKVKNVGKAVNVFANVAAELPTEGGWWKKVAGTATGISDFVGELNGVPQAVKDLSSQAEDFEQTDIDRIQKVADAITIMSDVAGALPKGTTFMSSGLAQGLTGYSNLKIFAKQLADFVPSFKEFTDACGPVGGDDTFGNLSRVKNVAAAVKAMAEAADAIPKGTTFFTGGVKQFFTGTSNLKIFAKQLAGFAPEFKKFSDTDFGNFDESKVTALSKGITALSKMTIDVSPESILKLTPIMSALKKVLSKIEGVGKIPSGVNLSKLSTNISTFTKNMAKVDMDASKVSSVMSDVKQAISKIQGIGKIPSGANLPKLAHNISSFTDSMSSVSTKGLGSKATSVSSAIKKLSKVASSGIKTSGDSGSGKSAGASIINGFIAGIKGKASAARSAAKSVATNAANGLKTNSGKGKSAGTNLAQGLINGLNSKKSAAYSAGYAVGAAAARGQKDGAKVASPSKEGIRTGKFLGEGLVIGMNSYKKKVYEKGYELGSLSAMGQMDGVYTDLGDLANPVITPVVDMSEVDAGLSIIDNAFSRKQAINIGANVQSSDDKMQKILNDAVLSMRKTANDRPNMITNNITVDGAENPEAFAQRFVRQVELEMRTG